MLFKSLFGRKKPHAGGAQTGYASVADFVDSNLADVKALLSSVGYNDLSKRLEDLAAMAHCHVMALCQKQASPNKYMVIESSDRNMCQRGTMFTWTHAQPTASADAAAALAALPFNIIGGTGFISVPVKNDRNMLTGILLGISTDTLTGLDSKTRLLHLMAPLLEAEIRCVKLRQDVRQCEQRIASLNQNIEVMNADLRKEQEQTMESRELKSIFLTNLSHEIRTPMNVIIGFIDLLEQTSDPDERKKFVEIVKQNSHQLLNVIDNLIEISKLQSSYMLKPACPVQLNELLTKIKMKYQDVLRKMGKDVTIETTFALEAPNDTIWNSDEIISKVMCQIMDNACRYTMTGKISISYTINHKEATFCVTDTGPGVKSGEEDKIFDMFDSSPISIKDEETSRGKGIGLAVARKYLMLANGRIWLDKTYKAGACFYFSIPTEKL